MSFFTCHYCNLRRHLTQLLITLSISHHNPLTPSCIMFSNFASVRPVVPTLTSHHIFCTCLRCLKFNQLSPKLPRSAPSYVTFFLSNLLPNTVLSFGIAFTILTLSMCLLQCHIIQFFWAPLHYTLHYYSLWSRIIPYHILLFHAE